VLTLHELQTTFCRSVIDAPSARLLELIAEDGIHPAGRLAIYRNNVLARLCAALSTEYPVVLKLVGEGFFAYAANTFVEENPPGEARLALYGDDFPEFLGRFPPALPLSYLSDVAKLECLIHQLRRAVSAPPIPITAVAAAQGNPSECELTINSAVRFMASAYPVDQLWSAHQGETDWQSLQLESTAVRLQISLIDGSLHINRQPPSVWEFRSSLARGDNLAIAVAAAMAISPTFDLPVALAELFRDGLVVGLNTAPALTKARAHLPAGEQV
jgi:Putative DNA-binding domain